MPSSKDVFGSKRHPPGQMVANVSAKGSRFLRNFHATPAGLSSANCGSLSTLFEDSTTEVDEALFLGSPDAVLVLRSTSQRSTIHRALIILIVGADDDRVLNGFALDEDPRTSKRRSLSRSTT